MRRPRKPSKPQQRCLNCAKWKMRTIGPIRMGWCYLWAAEMNAGRVACEKFEKEKVTR